MCVSFELSSVSYQYSAVPVHGVTPGMDPPHLTMIVMLDVNNLITQHGTALKRNANWQWNMNGSLIYNVQEHTSKHTRTHVCTYTCAHVHMHSQTSGGPMPYTSKGLHVVSSDDVQSQGHLLHARRGRVDTLMALIQNDIDSLVKPLQLSLKGKRKSELCHIYIHT